MTKLVKVADWTDSTRVNVVFIHGLGGNAYDTWRRGAEGNTFWPVWLARDIPGLAAWTLAYELGDGPALTESDVVGPAIAAEDIVHYSSLNPGMGTTIRRLAEFSPRTLALMHGPSFSGDGASALRALANDYDQRILRSRP